MVGFSEGGATAIIASVLLREPEMSIVFLGACGGWVTGRSEIGVRCRLLSIYEGSDELGTSCAPLAQQGRAPRSFREVRIRTKGRHGAFYRVREEGPLLQFLEQR